MAEYRRGPHSVYDIQYHLVWVTKYRYAIFQGEMGRCASSWRRVVDERAIR